MSLPDVVRQALGSMSSRQLEGAIVELKGLKEVADARERADSYELVKIDRRRGLEIQSVGARDVLGTSQAPVMVGGDNKKARLRFVLDLENGVPLARSIARKLLKGVSPLKKGKQHG